MPDQHFLPIAIAALSVFIGAAHSWLAEARVLGPLYAEGQGGILASRAMRDIGRLVWHLPSLAWILFGLALLFGSGSQVALHWAAFAMYALSGLGNMMMLRRFHFGGLLLLLTAGLTLADLHSKSGVF